MWENFDSTKDLICDTTECPTIHRLGEYGREEVRGPHFVCKSDLTANQFKFEPSMDIVADSCQRGEHTIHDVFHDSRGIESGSTEELTLIVASEEKNDYCME
jgi:hypothetical protein